MTPGPARSRIAFRLALATLIGLLLVALAAPVRTRAPDPAPPAQVALDDDEVGRLFDRPLPGLSQRTATPTATGNSAADIRIREVAVARGYRLRGEPLDPMGSYQGRLLQQRAIDDLRDLQVAMAADEGVSLTLTSAHRSASRQRELFLAQLTTSSLSLRGRVVSNSEIGLGLADDVLNHAMGRAAPPGFSRHHTGLVIDVSSEGLALFAFAGSRAYGWLTADGYANAMAYGWIPSYPPDASGQGPAPEPWEWAWIGRDAAECAVARSCAVGGLDAVDTARTVGWAATPAGSRAVAVRLATADGTDRLSGTWGQRLDVTAALGLASAVGFASDEGVPGGAGWACLEARTASGGPWSRVGCLALG